MDECIMNGFIVGFDLLLVYYMSVWREEYIGVGWLGSVCSWNMYNGV